MAGQDRRWSSGLRLRRYYGPYNRQILETAAHELGAFLTQQTAKNAMWRRIEAKTGLFSRHAGDTWGEHSCYYSQADLPSNKIVEATWTTEGSDTAQLEEGKIARQNQLSQYDVSSQSRGCAGTSRSTATATITSSSVEDSNSFPQPGNNDVVTLYDIPSTSTEIIGSGEQSSANDLFVLDYEGDKGRSLPDSAEPSASLQLSATFQRNETMLQTPHDSRSKPTMQAPVANDSGIVLNDSTTNNVIDISCDNDVLFISETFTAPDKAKSMYTSKAFKCPDCFLQFADRQSLNKHLDKRKRNGGKCSLLTGLRPLKQSVAAVNGTETCLKQEVSRKETKLTKNEINSASGVSQTGKRKVSINNEDKPSKRSKSEDAESLTIEVEVDHVEESEIEVTSDNGAVELDMDVSAVSQSCKVQTAYKCDFCSTVHISTKDMKTHLIEKSHASASFIIIEDQGNVKYTKTMCVLNENGSLYKTTAIKCPIENCTAVFQRPVGCIEHLRQCHPSYKEPAYAVVDIVSHESCTLSSSCFQCQKCSTVFAKQHELNKHYKSSHQPYVVKPGTFCVLLCRYCNMICYTFSDMANHMFSKHKKLPVKGTYTYEAMCISKDVRIMRHDPFKPTITGEIDSVNSRIAGIKELIAHSGKQMKRNLHKELKKTNQCLQSLRKTKKQLPKY